MSERPILFSAPMVRAILDGRKTVTRRVVKPQPPAEWSEPEEGVAWRGASAGFCGRQRVQVLDSRGEPDVDVDVIAFPVQRCPYGVPGDRLWVREPWRVLKVHDHVPGSELRGASVWYDADGPAPPADLVGRYRPGRFMPRWASRITLEVTGVRVERVQEIRGRDILAEGAVLRPHVDEFGRNPVSAFDKKVYLDLMSLWANGWDSINAKRGHGWATNPWVWVVEFRRLQ